jgi:protein-S-isoprenylcysteine O-methyltransferase Ste14
MTEVVAYLVMAMSLAGTVWGLLTAAIDKPPGAKQLIFAAVVELVVVLQSILALARLATGFRPVELATTVGYLLVIVILIPLAWFWANSERTRFSGVVMAIASLSVFGMTLRLLTLWTPAVS